MLRSPFEEQLGVLRLRFEPFLGGLFLATVLEISNGRTAKKVQISISNNYI